MGTERKKEGTEEAERRATSKEVKKWKGFWWELAKHTGPGKGAKQLLELKKGERSAVTDREVELRQLEFIFLHFLPAMILQQVLAFPVA